MEKDPIERILTISFFDIMDRRAFEAVFGGMPSTIGGCKVVEDRGSYISMQVNNVGEAESIVTQISSRLSATTIQIELQHHTPKERMDIEAAMDNSMTAGRPYFLIN